MPSEKLAALELESKTVEEDNKALVAEVKTLSAELAKIKSTPTDNDLVSQISEAEAKACILLDSPGFRLVEVERRVGEEEENIFNVRVAFCLSVGALRMALAMIPTFAFTPRHCFLSLRLWSLVSDNLTPQDAKDLAEDLGIEYDTPEHATLERSPLCSLPLKGRKK
ncbi:hypothetical protein EW146_g10516 [Bondarzewia mesenterica]|uniref:Uncharacterized protein n=1 Tax=Bondarzewia mesenterica TaxID=1095465 RepID=A0A4V6S134_9AGAM|nr:hypothetical protein EW146_g10516 [Bondarzewia mesenterica]